MNFILIQEQAESSVDTLTQSYSGKWSGAGGIENASGFVQLMASNDLIFVVLGVSLIIWFVLLFYMIKTDRKLSQLEKEIESKKHKDS